MNKVYFEWFNSRCSFVIVFLSTAGNCLWLCSLLISRSELVAPLYRVERNKKQKHKTEKANVTKRWRLWIRLCLTVRIPDRSFSSSPRSTSTSLYMQFHEDRQQGGSYYAIIISYTVKPSKHVSVEKHTRSAYCMEESYKNSKSLLGDSIKIK